MTVGWRSAWHVDTLRLGLYAPVEPSRCGFALPGGEVVSLKALQRARAETLARVDRQSYVPEPGEDVEETTGSERLQVWCDGVAGEVCGAPKPYQLGVKTSDFDVWLAAAVANPAEQSFPSAMVTFRAAALRVSVVDVLERAQRYIASAFGVDAPTDKAPWRDVVSRLDVACDVVTDEVTSTLFTRGQFVTRGRSFAEHAQANAIAYAPWDPPADVDGLVRYWNGRRHTGYTLGARGRRGTQMRLYDKAWHARKAPEAAHIFEAWKREGWDGHAWLLVGDKKRGSVWRCEFELGAEPLKRLGYQTFEVVRSRGLGGLVGWLVGRPDIGHGWARVVVDDDTAPDVGHAFEADDRGRVWTHSNRPEERALLPFWEALQGAATEQTFPGHVVERSKAPLKRGTAQLLQQARGCFAAWAMRTGASPKDISEAMDTLFRTLPEAMAERVHEVPWGSDANGSLDAVNGGLRGWIDGVARAEGAESADGVPVLWGGVGDVLRAAERNDVRRRSVSVGPVAVLQARRAQKAAVTSEQASDDAGPRVDAVAEGGGQNPFDGGAVECARQTTSAADAAAEQVDSARQRFARHHRRFRERRYRLVERHQRTADAGAVLERLGAPVPEALTKSLEATRRLVDRAWEVEQWCAAWAGETNRGSHTHEPF